MTNGNQVIAVAKAIIHPDESLPRALEYYIYQKAGLGGRPLYGLRVDKRSLDGELLEREETPSITSSLEEVMALANAFATGTVPPCVLLEMVDEWYDLDDPAGVHTAWEENIA